MSRNTYIRKKDYPEYAGALLKRSTYRGDSLGKKLTRFSLWRDILTKVKAKDATFLVLAGREGADVQCLEGLGVPVSQIVGSDTDPIVLREFQNKYPGVQTVIGDFAYAVDFCAPRVLYADVCGQITHHTVCRITHAARFMEPGSLIAITILKGREWDEGRTGMGVTLPQALNQSNWLRAKALIDKELLDSDPEIQKILCREQLLCSAFNHMLQLEKKGPPVGLKLLRTIGYQSGGMASFVVSLFRVTRKHQPLKQKGATIPEIYLGTLDEFREVVRDYQKREQIPAATLQKCLLVNDLERGE